MIFRNKYHTISNSILSYFANFDARAYIEIDDLEATHEDLTDKEIFELLNPENDDDFDANDDFTEIPSITKNDAPKSLDCLFTYLEQKEIFFNDGVLI